jgi:hypothetical protein
MPNPARPTIDEVLRQMTPIDEAIREGAREAVQMHQRLGNPIAVWREDQAVDVPAEEVLPSCSEPSEKTGPARRKAV